MSGETMKKSAVLCVVLLGAMTVDTRAAVPLRAPAPALVLRAAAVYAANVRGVIGMQRHFSTVLHTGPVHHTEESDSGYLMNDGSFVKIEYVRIVDDGKAFSAKQTAQRDAQTNQDWSVGKIFFKEPYDRRFIGDYVFDAPKACAACPAGTVSVSFGSSIHDTQHGSGTMWIELATGRVDRLTYIPNVLPPHATFGTVTETSGWAMPNVWYVTRIDGVYRGKIFVLSGTGTFTGVFDHFRRFSTVAQGKAALSAGTI
ncbi:hypothetical protein EPN42_06230 [bacterium]|nr:MAG: hypothetical protein EPN42_06230 [bacterium]